MVLKTYKILVSYGDGKPVESKVEATSGLKAQDLALAGHPGARSIRILGIESERIVKPKAKIPIQRPDLVVKEKEEDKIHPLFTDVSIATVKQFETRDRQQKINQCLELFYQGFSYKAIASQLGIGKTTVGKWINTYRPE